MSKAVSALIKVVSVLMKAVSALIKAVSALDRSRSFSTVHPPSGGVHQLCVCAILRRDHYSLRSRSIWIETVSALTKAVSTLIKTVSNLRRFSPLTPSSGGVHQLRVRALLRVHRYSLRSRSR